ncbi:MAG: aminopeptidase P family protein [Acidobacteria bacterium]|nr:aminopeptidase P family protein [Acidobacteriota bacterium]
MIHVNWERVRRAQRLMVEHEMSGLMILNHDDFRYFFGADYAQPRAIILSTGEPIFVVFAAEEPELRQALGDVPVKVATHVGEQIFNVRQTFQAVFGGPPPGMKVPADGRPRIGMQMWFDTPAFLVDMFRRVNGQVALVSSDPVMDELRMVKEPREIELMRTAQAIAATGMDRARDMLRPGVTGHEIATEVIHAMMQAGAEGTSTPVYVNSGARSCWIHGKVTRDPIRAGDLVVIDLTPRFEGYCANLARTFSIGPPTEIQLRLLTTYREMQETARSRLRPGVTTAEIDLSGREVCERAALAEYRLNGIAHGIGLRFEETPATTIIPKHRNVPLREGMTMTVGHTILAVPGVGGARFEDVFRVTPAGGELLHPYPLDWEIGRA